MIVQGQTTAFKKYLYDYLVQNNAIYIALYTADATLNQNTTWYTSENEVVSDNYTPGGKQLTGYASSSSNGTAYLTFDNVVWENVSFPAVRGALIYNSTYGGMAIAVLDFGSDKTVVNSTFTITFPANTASTAIIRSSN